MKEHAPRSTEKQSGIVFHNGQVVIIYEDGIENPEDKKGKIIGEREGDKQKLLLVEHSLNQAKAALEEETKSLEEIVPKGYKTGMSDSEIRKLMTGDYTPAELISKLREKVEPIEARIENLNNEILMDTHEKKRLTYSISAWDKML